MSETASASTSSSHYVCSISGRETSDPVVTPSGYVCDRKLLLTKLTENGGIDPFVSDNNNNTTLDESQLISIRVDKKPAVIPPRPAAHSSFSSLLTSIQSEHDSLLLELFDTRKTLEETRMELSQALYQNDAAVRVIARISVERDRARDELAKMATTVQTQQQPQPQPQPIEQEPPEAGRTEAMEVVDASEAPSSKKPKLEESSGPPQQEEEGIPKSDLDVMITSWKKLSSGRRKRSKQSKDMAPLDLSKFDLIQSRNLHRTNKPGMTCLSVVIEDPPAAVATPEGCLVATGGKDRSVVLYDASSETIADTLSGGFKGEITDVDSVVVSSDEGGGAVVLAAGCADGIARVFHGRSDSSDGGYRALGEVDFDGDAVTVVGVDLHPTGRYLIAAGSDGDVRVARIDLPDTAGEGGGVVVLTTLRNELVGRPLKDGGGHGAEEGGGEEVHLTCGGLHPDGLIYGVGTSTGELRVWDLKTQKLASTLTGHTGAVTSLDFSENGYHFASSSSTGEVFVWDLRKLKKIATLNEKPTEEGEGGGAKKEGGEGDGDGEGDEGWYVGDSVNCVAFDHTGRYLAYAGENGTRVTVVKEWGRTASFPPPVKKKKGGKASKGSGEASVAWGKWGGSGGIGGGGVVVVTATGADRALKFWGLPQQDAQEGGADMEEDTKVGEEGGKVET